MARGERHAYFSSTTAPCASSFFLISSASCFDTPSFTAPPASTRSFASLRPRFVTARTSLMTWIFFSPPLFNTTVNSVCSSTAGAAAPPAAAPAAGAAATGAAIVTLNFALNASISSASSNTDMLPIAAMISSLPKVVCVAMWLLSRLLVFQRLKGPHHRHEQSVQRTGEACQRRLQGAAQLRQQCVPCGQRREPRDLLRTERLTLHQADLDLRLLEFPGELGEDFRRRHRVHPREHQRRRAIEVPFQPALAPRQLRFAQRAQRQGVLHHHVLDAGRPQPPPEVRDPRDVQAREVRHIQRGRALELRRQRRHDLLLLRLGADHTYVAGSSGTPGPIVLETVTERMYWPLAAAGRARTISSRKWCRFSASASGGNDFFPIGAWTIPLLSTRNSILPAFSSLTARATSIVTVPALGFGIRPRGPRIFPRGAICPIRSGVATIASVSSQPSLIFWMYSTPTKSAPAASASFALSPPAICFIADSSEVAFRSGILSSAIFCTCARVTVPTFWRLDVGEPFSMPASFLRSTAAGGVLVMKVNVRSLKIVTTTGVTIPIWEFVLALNCFTNSMMLTPWGPSAVPTGGAGVACPAGTCSLTTAT